MDKKSLILGGTRGLGYAIARESAERNVQPIIVGRSAEEGGRDTGIPSAIFWRADLSNEEGVDTIWDRGGSTINIKFVFWVAGIFLRKRMLDCGFSEIQKMIDIHFTGPVKFLTGFHRVRFVEYPVGYPYHLVTIASTSSWRMRDNETVYCALKAAKAHFTRNFARELVRDLPGSKVTLVNPGGLKTPDFWRGTNQDIQDFMEPDEVARIIWDEVLGQREDFEEINIMRNDGGSPQLIRGQLAPEHPFKEIDPV